MFGANNICHNQQKIYDTVRDIEYKMEEYFKVVWDNQKIIGKRLNQIESLIKQIQDKCEEINK